jgi:nucleotide-binding universal stress UspA family protein
MPLRPCLHDFDNMQHSTFMVYVSSGAESDTRVRIASELAAHFKSELIGISVCTYPANAFAANGPVTDDEISFETRSLTAELERRKARFLQVAGERSFHSTWRSGVHFPTQCVLNELRSSDLLIIGREESKGKFNVILEPVAVLLRAGRPVLMIPNNIQSLSFRRVVIGWKDTREARRVVLDALPYLRHANSVILTAIGETDEKEAEIKIQLKDVADYLAGHGVSCEPKIIERPKRSAGDEIIHLAKEEGADVIVAGAYGHSRAGEWVFGGVTETLVTKSPISCFFSH